jgi:hypothetical protein
MDFCKRLGQPVVFRHMFSQEEVLAGTAQRCPACWEDNYDQGRNDCPVCFGIGFASVALSDDPTLYIDTNGQIVHGDPGTGVRAPKYGGFDEPFLTWMVEPDVVEDWFKISEEGEFERVYDAEGFAPWYPKLHDNDLCVNVTLDPGNYTIASSDDRFQLKMVQQITIRGEGRLGRPQPIQSFLINQKFRMNRIPYSAHSLNAVPIDV